MSRPPLSAILNPPDTSLFANLKRRTQGQQQPFSYAPTERLDVIKTRNSTPGTDSTVSSNLKVRKIRQRRRASDSEVLHPDDSELSLPLPRTPVPEQLFPSNNYDFGTTPKANRYGNLQDSISAAGCGSEYSYSDGNNQSYRTYSQTPTPIQDFGFWNLSGLLSSKNGRGDRTRPRSSSFGKVMEFKKGPKDSLGPSGLRRASANSALMSDADEGSITSNDTSRSASVSDLREAAGRASKWRNIRDNMVSPLPSKKKKEQLRLEARTEPPPFGVNSYGPIVRPSDSTNSYYQPHPGREVEQNSYIYQNWQPLQPSPSQNHNLREDLKTGGKRIMSALFPLKKNYSRSSSKSATTGISSRNSLQHHNSTNSRQNTNPPKPSSDLNRTANPGTPTTPPQKNTRIESDDETDNDTWSTPPSRVTSMSLYKKSPNGSGGSPATVITSVDEEDESGSEASLVADRPFTAWREGRSRSNATTTPSPSNLNPFNSPLASHYSYQQSKNGYLLPVPQLPWMHGKSGRPPFLRLVVEATSEVDKIEARGQQGCWVAVVVRAEVCSGDWDLQIVNELGRGLDVVLVLDISAYTSPASFPALLAAAKQILTLLNQEKDSIAIITVTADPGSRNLNMPAAVETIHFLSPATKTITRHLISVIESLKANNSKLSPKTRPLKKAITQAAGLFSARHTENARHILFLSASELPDNCMDGLVFASDISIHRIAIGPIFIPNLNSMTAPLRAHHLQNPKSRVLKTDNNGWSIPFVGKENTGVKRFILPGAPDIPMLLSFLRSDIKLGALENVRLSLQPGNNCRIEQALGNLEMRKLVPGDSAIICVKLIVGPATGIPMDLSDPNFQRMMNNKTSGVPNRNGPKVKTPLIVADDEDTVDRWSVLEQHLEATLGELNTTILTIAAYYNHPFLDNGESSVVSLTERVSVRRFVKGSIWDVSAAFDANGMMRRGERVVRQALLQALAMDESYIYAEHVQDFDVLGGDELDGWKELRAELEYLTEREFLPNPSGLRPSINSGELLRHIEIGTDSIDHSATSTTGNVGTYGRRFNLGTFSTNSTTSYLSPSYPPSPYPTLNLDSPTSGETLGLAEQIRNQQIKGGSFGSTSADSPKSDYPVFPEKDGEGDVSSLENSDDRSYGGRDADGDDDDDEDLLLPEEELEEEEEEDEARKIWQELGFIPKGSMRRRAEFSPKRRVSGRRITMEMERNEGYSSVGNFGVEELRKEVRWDD